MTGVLTAPPQRFAVKFDVADRDRELFFWQPARPAPRRSTPNHAAFLHIIRKIILRVGSYTELPRAEAALT